MCIRDSVKSILQKPIDIYGNIHERKSYNQIICYLGILIRNLTKKITNVLEIFGVYCIDNNNKKVIMTVCIEIVFLV